MLRKAYKPISAIVFAGLIAGAWIVLPIASDPVVASAPLNSGKGDRLDIRPIGAQCSQQAWPYLEANCLRDRRTAMGQAKPARVVTADRIGPTR
jgi:hypothetical protein